jgi:hypothetical protein
MHDGMGGMMWSMGIGHLLLLIVVLLAIAALIQPSGAFLLWSTSA